jgi:hypothetical protein
VAWEASVLLAVSEDSVALVQWAVSQALSKCQVLLVQALQALKLSQLVPEVLEELVVQEVPEAQVPLEHRLTHSLH